jgi:hypothetical protein
MATSTLRRDYLLRRLVTPASDSKDHLGRATTSTVDSSGRALIARDFPGAVAAVNGEYIDIPATRIVYKVESTGTFAAGAPTAPGVGNTVVSGSVTMRQLTNAGT